VIYFLIILIFIAKVSLSSLVIFPKEIEPFIYQYGLHPYMNIAFNFFLGGLVCLNWLWKGKTLYRQSRFYRFLTFVTCLYLIFITFLQSFFVNADESLLLQMGSACMAVFTIFLYGRVIPTSVSPERFLSILKKTTVFLVGISLFLLFISPGTSFKGTRFIGIFKHIPHMVSCATLACFCLFHSLFVENSTRAKRLTNYFFLATSFFLLILTGTRSALAAVILGFFVCLIIFKSDSPANRFLKTSVALSFVLIFMFFGHDIADYSVAVIRGEQSLGNRAAQDGLKSRWDEVERGFEIFQKEQWMGQGLLSKFSNGQDAEISNYSANKDPHNIFISAGVVGGWGFVFLTFIALASLSIASLKSLLSKNKAIQVLAIYMITHIPILFIYHVHLSLGGIADRIYWIVIGYMTLKEIDLKNANE
jgi:hypothetical protein